MILTRSQQARFWSDWAAIKRQLIAQGLDPTQIENERHALLERAGFDSLTKVDQMTGFDRVIAELSALYRPADLDTQLRQAQMPHTRLIYSIEHSGLHPNYIATIALNRFGTRDWRSLPPDQIQKLHLTISNRKRKKPSRAAATQEHNPF